MENLKSSFDDVADWMERYLEGQRGPEVGMTFGAMLRVCGQLAKLQSTPGGQVRTAEERELMARSELLLASLSVHLHATDFRTGSRVKPVESASMRTNMIYDPGSQK